MNLPPGLRRLLLALLPSWLGWSASQALIGWLVFAATASPALVGLAFALRLAPLALAGVPIGALSDRVGRTTILRLSNLLAVAISFAIVLLSVLDLTPLAVLLVAAATFGLADAGRMVTGTNLAYDLAGDFGTTRAVAASTFVSGTGAALGGAIAGLTLSLGGPSLAAAVVGVSYAAGSLLLIGVSDHPVAVPHAAPSLATAVVEGLAMLHRVPNVGVLIGVALAVELFAFSCVALDPVFAGKVFLAGPAGLGVILAARQIGRLIGSGMLAVAPHRRALGRALALAVLGFGLGLIAYAFSPGLLIAAPIVLGVGVASVVVDALVLTALQAGVDAGSRGRVAGLWVVIVGLQPIGVLEVGLVAQIAGARFAQVLNGLIVVALGLLLVGTALGRRIRDIETRAAPAHGPQPAASDVV